MNYDGILYRPPSEAQSLLIQMTVGCSYNQCDYCAMYRDRDFRIRPLDEVKADIREGGAFRFKRVFLCDGDALVVPMPYLREILPYLQEHVPGVERIGCYGEVRSILKKSEADLRELARLGLGIIYHGVESGDDATLKSVNRGTSSDQAIEAGRKVRGAGIQYSAIVMLGLAGKGRGREHMLETARVLNAIQPDFIGVLTTMLVDGTPLWERAERGEFQLPSRMAMLEELAVLLENLQLKTGLLTTRHSSNYLPLRIVFPYQREPAIRQLREVLAKRDETVLKPEYLRGL